MASYGTEPGVSATKIPYPKSILFIIGNEFCERFSYYGMRAILVLYFRYILEYTENTATQAYHIFAMACFFTPILGAFIADSLIGKFWTILSISIVYAAGNIILSVAAIKGTVVFTFLGLGLIALGTGGIKPCVSAFGGDQFKPEQKKELQQFFSFFYISINAGSLISTFLTPILRQDVSCGGRSDCYPLAFGVPAALMVIALGLFVMGRFITGYTINPPQKDNVVVMVVRCVCRALSKRFFSNAPKRNHWLEYADDRYDPKTINEVKTLMAILFLYLPLPIFWALFDQQGSRWTLQATRMNGQLTDSFIIKPDQIQVINPLLIIVMIPIFEYGIYPVLNKLNLNRPLQRMTIGGVLAGVSFIICALMQIRLEAEQPVAQVAGHNHVALVNGLHCNVAFFNETIGPYKVKHWPNVDHSKLTSFDQQFKVTNENGSNCREGTYHISKFINITDESVILFVSEKIYQNSINFVLYQNILRKPDEGGALMFTLFNLANYDNQTFKSTQVNGHLTQTVVSVDSNGVSFGYLKQFEIEITGREVIMSVAKQQKQLHLEQGATYIQLISGDVNGDIDFYEAQIVDKNNMSVFWQLIQYLVITAAEIMFSVTGLEFSYSQSPKSMKSVLQACWLLTMAFGNLIVAVIADLKIFPKQSHEFFFFGGLMIVDMAIFAIMAKFYVPFKSVDSDSEDEGDAEQEETTAISSGNRTKRNWND